MIYFVITIFITVQTGSSVEIDLCGEKLLPNGSTTTTVLKGITKQSLPSNNGTALTVNNGSTAVWLDPAWVTLGDRYVHAIQFRQLVTPNDFDPLCRDD